MIEPSKVVVYFALCKDVGTTAGVCYLVWLHFRFENPSMCLGHDSGDSGRSL